MDMTSAKPYGELVTLYPEQPNDVFACSKHTYLIKNKLKDAESSDYLLVVGNMILVLLTFGVLLEKFGYVNVLLYDVRKMTYVPRVVAKHHLTMGEV
jgi:hypothetical protein